MNPEKAGAAYVQLIDEQLREERSRKVSLEGRGISVITTSGTIVALLFGLTAGLTAGLGHSLPKIVRLPLLLSLIAFVAAASLGLATNVPLKYREPTSRGLAKLIDPIFWSATAITGELRVSEAKVRILSAARTANNLKAMLYIIAIGSELLATVFLAWAVVAILYNGY